MKILIVILAFSLAAFAAPIPGTSTSKLVSPEIGLYHSPIGFQMNSGKTGWAHVAPPRGNKFIATMYMAQPTSIATQMHADLTGKIKTASPATLTVRVDELEKDIALEKYIQKWLKEYPRYGFDVLGSKAFVQNKQKGYVLDLVNRDQGKQLRQVVFLKQKKAVILTCRDKVASFQTTLKSCNEIIKSFVW